MDKVTNIDPEIFSAAVASEDWSPANWLKPIELISEDIPGIRVFYEPGVSHPIFETGPQWATLSVFGSAVGEILLHAPLARMSPLCPAGATNILECMNISVISLNCKTTYLRASEDKMTSVFGDFYEGFDFNKFSFYDLHNTASFTNPRYACSTECLVNSEFFDGGRVSIDVRIDPVIDLTSGFCDLATVSTPWDHDSFLNLIITLTKEFKILRFKKNTNSHESTNFAYMIIYCLEDSIGILSKQAPIAIVKGNSCDQLVSFLKKNGVIVLKSRSGGRGPVRFNPLMVSDRVNAKYANETLFTNGCDMRSFFQYFDLSVVLRNNKT